MALGGSVPVVRRARWLLLAGAVLPVLVLTGALAAIGFAGARTAGPLPGSVFAAMGWVAASVVPLGLLSLGLSGDALRERSPGHAFAAGLIAAVTVMGGYALAV